MPGTPAVIAFQVFSVPMPTGLMRPTPVTTTRRSEAMARVFPSALNCIYSISDDDRCGGASADHDGLHRASGADGGARADAALQCGAASGGIDGGAVRRARGAGS